MKPKYAFLVVLALSVTALAQSSSLSSLKTKAQAGDGAAQLALGRAYERGEAVPRNYELAVKWYRAAAEQGVAEAQSDLGVMYRLGHGVEQDKEEAVKWYSKAAKQGFGPAMFNLGTAYYNGDGVGISDRFAYAWFVLAKRAGSNEAAEAVTRMDAELASEKLAYAKATLAEMVEKGSDLPKADPAFAFQIYEDIAKSTPDSSLIDAKFQLGRMSAEGIGVPKNPEAAVNYFNASGTRLALRCLATMYMEGKGIPADPKKGLAALNKLAEFRDEVALNRLAGYYWDGGPVPQNYKQAVKYYTVLAIQKNDPLAFFRLGIASRDGLGGMKKSVDDTCFYFILAYNAGSPDASNAGQQLCQGNTLTKAKDRALKWAKQNGMVLPAAQDREKTSNSRQKSASDETAQ